MKKNKLIALSVLGLLVLVGVALALYFIVFKKKSNYRSSQRSGKMLFGGERMMYQPRYKTTEVAGTYTDYTLSVLNSCINVSRDDNPLLAVDENHLSFNGTIYRFIRTDPSLGVTGDSDLYVDSNNNRLYVWGIGVLGDSYSIALGYNYPNNPTMIKCF
jgi:hypothetical protein